MRAVLQRIRHAGQSRMLRNAGWMLFGQGAGVVLQAVNFIVLARLLGSAEYGIFVGAFAFTSLVAQYSALGMGAIFLRYVSGAFHEFRVYWGNILIATTLIGGALAFVLHLLAPALLNAQSAALVAVLGVANCIFAQLTVETGRVFQAFEKMRITAILNLLTNFARAITAVGMLLVIHHATAWQWAIASTVVSALAALAAFVLVTVQFGWPQFSFRAFTRNSAEGTGFAFASSTTSAYNDLDKTMLSHYGMNVQNGIYTMAYRIVDIATIPIFSLRDAALPRLFQKGREGGVHAAAELGWKLLKRVFPISLLLCIGMFVAAPLIPIFVGHGFAQSVAALRWLCLIPVFRSVHQMTGCALTGAGYQNYRTGAQLAATLLNFGLNLWLIPRYGWLGAAWSSLATDGALGVLNYGILEILVGRDSKRAVIALPETRAVSEREPGI